MHVDEAGRHGLATRIDDTRGLGARDPRSRYGNDPITLDADIRESRGGAGSVNDGATGYQHVIAARLLCWRLTIQTLRGGVRGSEARQ